MLISEAYRAEQTELHARYLEYGSASIGYAPIVSELINRYKVVDLLDYGAGKCRLSKHLVLDHRVAVTSYDPAIADISEVPKEPHEMVACVDVLEHVEPECLDAVLDDLQRLTRRIGVFTVHCGPAVKVLRDGRNAHLTQEGAYWWLPRIMTRFVLESFIRTDNGFWVVVSPLGRAKQTNGG